jgi:hypothetical protein
MQAAPPNAIYVWCNNFLRYPVHLARFLHREDLQIVGPAWLNGYAWEGKRLSAIVLDHATVLEPRQEHILDRARERVLLPDEPCGHPGCRSHVTHPCEGCGRIAGRCPDAAFHDYVDAKIAGELD